MAVFRKLTITSTLLGFWLILVSCHSKARPNQQQEPTNTRFELIDERQGMGSSLIMNREMKNPESIFGDFLSRIWAIAGPPNAIHYEGFSYTFRDKETGLIFTAYTAGSGPAYGGLASQKDSLLPVIRAFDQTLDRVTPADCEIEFDTDFGTLVCGAKDGVPYDRMEGY